MIEPILSSKAKEIVLIFTVLNDEFYPSQLSNIFKIGQVSFQNQAEKLELGGILSSQLKGKVRIYSFNPRYPFLKELVALMKKVYEFLPKEDKDKYIVRNRPRRINKPL